MSTESCNSLETLHCVEMRKPRRVKWLLSKANKKSIRIHKVLEVLVATKKSTAHVTLFTENIWWLYWHLIEVHRVYYTELESSTRVMRELLASNDYSVHSIVNRPENTALCMINGTNIFATTTTAAKCYSCYISIWTYIQVRQMFGQ